MNIRIFCLALLLLACPAWAQLKTTPTTEPLDPATNRVTASGNTNFVLNMNLEYGLLTATNHINITNLSNVNVTRVNNFVLLIDDGGAERALSLPASWYTHDGAHVYYVSNSASLGVLSISVYPKLSTSSVYRLFKQ